MASVENERAVGFGGQAADYHRFRPGTPPAAVDWLVEPGVRNAVELGAGTGHFSGRLAGKVAEVYAVEPDQRMRAVLTEHCPAVHALPGSAEDIPLPDCSVDAVFAVDAWHWFDKPVACAEIARVLRPGGYLGVLWNNPNDQVPWANELFSIIIDHDPDHLPNRFELPPGAPFHQPERFELSWTAPMSPAEVVALLGTYSAVLAMPEQTRNDLARRSLDYLRRHPDLADRPVVEMPYLTVCWRARMI